MFYERNDFDLKRGSFRVKGDVLEIIPISQHGKGYRIEFFGDTIDRISEFDALTGTILQLKKSITIFPVSFYVTRSEEHTSEPQSHSEISSAFF